MIGFLNRNFINLSIVAVPIVVALCVLVLSDNTNAVFKPGENENITPEEVQDRKQNAASTTPSISSDTAVEPTRSSAVTKENSEQPNGNIISQAKKEGPSNQFRWLYGVGALTLVVLMGLIFYIVRKIRSNR